MLYYDILSDMVENQRQLHYVNNNSNIQDKSHKYLLSQKKLSSKFPILGYSLLDGRQQAPV